jgi:hypothetical protein
MGGDMRPIISLAAARWRSRASSRTRRALSSPTRRARLSSRRRKLQRVKPLLDLHGTRWSALPGECGQWLVECHLDTRGNTGSSSILSKGGLRALRVGDAVLVSPGVDHAGDVQPLSANDYGFGLVSPRPVRARHLARSASSCRRTSWSAHILSGLTSPSSGAGIFARSRAFAGLVFQGFPGDPLRSASCRRRARLLYNVVSREIRPRHNPLLPAGPVQRSAGGARLPKRPRPRSPRPLTPIARKGAARLLLNAARRATPPSRILRTPRRSVFLRKPRPNERLGDSCVSRRMVAGEAREGRGIAKK